MIYLDDMILVKDQECTGGSKILEGFRPPFDAFVVTRLREAGLEFQLRRTPAEFSHGRVDVDCLPRLVAESCGSYGLAAQRSGKVFIKPTYGTVSRFGIIPMACSGEQVGVLAETAAEARELLTVIAGHDDKDGTSYPAPRYDYSWEGSLKLGSEGLPDPALSQVAWDVLYCAEACNNLSRYDGVKFGYRTKNYKNIDELYVGTRTEGFTFPTKQVILYGSDILSKGRYESCYVKALQLRRVLLEQMKELLKTWDVLECQDVYLPLITGLPALTVGGRQFIADSFCEGKLFRLAEKLEKGEAV